MRLGQTQPGLSLYPTVVTPPPTPPPAVGGPFVPVDLSAPIVRKFYPTIDYQRDLSRYAPVAVAGSLIAWDPGHYVQVGNPNHSNGNGDNQNIGGIILAKDINNTLKGMLGVYHWDQLENNTPLVSSSNPAGVVGDYSNGDALLDPMFAWCQARNLSWSIAISGTANGVAQGSTTFATIPGYMNSTVYGPVDANGNHGGLYYTTVDGPITRFSNPNTMTRMAALGAHLWQRYGAMRNPNGKPTFFSFQPMWSELSFQPPVTTTGGISTAAIISTMSNSGGFFDQIRAAMPGTYIYVEATYLAFGNPAAMAPWYAATKRNFLTNGNFDSCNETGGVKQRANVGDPAFRGGQMSGGVFSPVAGLTDLVAAGEDFATHKSEDTMCHRGNGIIPGNSTQGAWLGDGRQTITWQHEIEMNASHVFWGPNGVLGADNRGSGPNCNRFVNQTSGTSFPPPPNYTESAPWASRGMMGFIDFIGAPPRLIKPSWWP